MKRSPLLNPSSVMKRSLWSYCAVFLVVAGVGANAFAGTPIWVNIYQSMEQGNAGDLLTNTAMNATSYGSQGWVSTPGPMWVSNNYHVNLPNPINCGGTVYNGTGGSRSWMFNNNLQMSFVQVNLASGYTNMTLAFYYTTLTTLQQTVGYDTIDFTGGGSFSCLQTLGGPPVPLPPDVYPVIPGPLLRQHSSITTTSTGTGTFAYIVPGHTYWVNMKYDGAAGVVLLAVFDPANGYSQLANLAFCQSVYADQNPVTWFGRVDAHGNQSNETTQSYFDQIMLDYTNAAFPLLPSGYNDVTPPNAPPAVRDGAGYGFGTQEQTMAMSFDAVVGQLGPGVGRRERNQSLPVLHRHHCGRNERGELDHDPKPVGNNEDRVEPELGPEILFQREGHQRRGIYRRGDDFPRANLRTNGEHGPRRRARRSRWRE